MNRVIRLTLLSISLLLFIIINPLVVLYAIGYRLNGKQGIPESIGVLLVDSLPHRANVFLNDGLTGKTPRAISNLKPGDVSVRMELPGYQPWQKRVHIEPTLATEFRSVRLFPVSPPKTQLATNVALFSLSPNNQLLAVTHQDQTLEIIDRQGQGVTTTPVKLDFTPTQLTWSFDNASVLVSSRKQVAFFSMADQAVHNLQAGAFQENTFTWDLRLPNRLLYLSATGQVMAINTINGQKDILLADITAFSNFNSGLVAGNSAGRVAVYDFLGKEQTVLIAKADKKIQRLLAYGNNKVVILSADHSADAIMNGGFTHLADDVRDTAFSPDGTLLFLQTGANEIQLYDADNGQLPFISKGELKLVTRLSQPLRNIAWFAGGEHVLYQTNDEIIISEIDTRDHPVTYRLDATDLGEPLTAIDATGKMAYYLKKMNGQIVLVSAQLQLP